MSIRSVRLFYACYSLLTASHRAILLSRTVVRAGSVGVWLGLVKRESFMRIGDLFNAAHERYSDYLYSYTVCTFGRRRCSSAGVAGFDWAYFGAQPRGHAVAFAHYKVTWMMLR